MSQPRRRQWLIDGRPRLACALLILAALSIGMLLFEGSRPAAASSGVAPFPHFDKVLHFGAHGWVAGLLFWGGYLLGRPQSLRMRALVWAGLVMASGLVANAGLERAVALAATDREAAIAYWASVETVADALGGGAGEFAGGLTTLLLGLASVRAGFARGAGWLGVAVGLIGFVSTLPVLYDLGGLFGVGQIAWFAWTGVALIRSLR